MSEEAKALEIAPIADPGPQSPLTACNAQVMAQEAARREAAEAPAEAEAQ